MQRHMRQLGYGVALLLTATGLGSCQFLSNDKASEATATAPTTVAPETLVEAEEVIAAEPAEEEKVAAQPIIAATPLTRPTDPEARVKVIKKGRENPFAPLIPVKSRDSALDAAKKAPAPSALSKPSARPKLSKTDKPGIVLPSLPAEPTLAKQVKVQGVMVIAGKPQAILQAPEEGIIRTVSAGDYLSDGKVLVSAIDVRNQQEPVVILKEAGRTVSVGVGKEPIVSGGPSSPIGLPSSFSKPS